MTKLANLTNLFLLGVDFFPLLGLFVFHTLFLSHGLNETGSPGGYTSPPEWLGFCCRHSDQQVFPNVPLPHSWLDGTGQICICPSNHGTRCTKTTSQWFTLSDLVSSAHFTRFSAFAGSKSVTASNLRLICSIRDN
jgi:hypothetical protein